MDAATPCGLGNWGPDWTDPGVCEYCGVYGPVKIEPFGKKPACQEDWEAICYGEWHRRVGVLHL